MKYIVIMPEDCYKSTSGKFKGCIVRKPSTEVERAGFNEVRYLFDLSNEAIKQAWKLHTCDAVVTPCDGDNLPCKITYVPKAQGFKMMLFFKGGRHVRIKQRKSRSNNADK